MNETCCVCFLLKIPAKPSQTTTSNIIKCSHIIHRYALHNKGTVGSIYDCWIDGISSDSHLDKNFITEKEINSDPECFFISEDKLRNDNLLQVIDMNNELKTSITLGMISDREGMAMLYDYRFPVDGTIRILYYNRIDYQLSLVRDIDVIKSYLYETLKINSATHFVMNVKLGIDFVIIFEFPTDENMDEIDSILMNMAEYLKQPNSKQPQLNELEKLKHVKTIIFSKLDTLCSFQNRRSLTETCEYIHRYLSTNKFKTPLNYELHPINFSNSNGMCHRKRFSEIDASIHKEIQKINLSSIKLKCVDDLALEIQSMKLPEHMETCFSVQLNKLCEVKDSFKCIQQGWADIVLKLRQGKDQQYMLQKYSYDQQHKNLEEDLEEFYLTFNKMKRILRLVNKLENNYYFEYFNMAQLEDDDDDQQTLETKLISHFHSSFVRILCSSLELDMKYSEKHEQFYQQLLNEKQMNSSLRVIFADFSYCNVQLSAPKLLSTLTKKLNDINVLLVSESHIISSTFINAFANCLSYETLEKAEQTGPIVLTPVRFELKACETTSLLRAKPNEELNSLNQTTLTCCQSYIFDLGDKKKLHFIDTPSISDIDETNIQHILSYINNLSHINAVCVLLKADVSHLNILFRSRLEQIFHFLGRKTHDNVIFCFTNSRVTFHSSNDSTLLLKKILNELSNEPKPHIDKTNQFFFDNETFQCLSMKMSQVNTHVSDEAKIEFDKNWTKSLSEFIRLINYVETCSPFEMNIFQSLKHVEIIIQSLVRPMIEILRLNLRNSILEKMKMNQGYLYFNPHPITKLKNACLTCSFQVKHVDQISMIVYSNDNCQCKYNQKLQIDYELEYQLINETINDTKYDLLKVIILFTQFLRQIARNDEDIFLQWVNLFIQEESYLCSRDSSRKFNRKLYVELIAIRNEYEERLNNQVNINIDEIYQSVEQIKKLDDIIKQVNASRESQIMRVKNHEYDISLQYRNMLMTEI